MKVLLFTLAMTSVLAFFPAPTVKWPAECNVFLKNKDNSSLSLFYSVSNQRMLITTVDHGVQSSEVLYVPSSHLKETRQRGCSVGYLELPFIPSNWISDSTYKSLDLLTTPNHEWVLCNHFSYPWDLGSLEYYEAENGTAIAMQFIADDTGKGYNGAGDKLFFTHPISPTVFPDNFFRNLCS